MAWEPLLSAMKEPFERFTPTVENYIKYRPTYPIDVLTVLNADCQFSRDKIVADIGSGTGILTKLFLDNGNIVYGVEPNQAMRQAAEKQLNYYANFHSIDGSAENTGLKNASIDLITVGTAFHWFDVKKTKIEFKRILKTAGWVLLVWNVRDTQVKVLADYEQLILTYGIDYQKTHSKKFSEDELKNFFSPHEMKSKTFKNTQWLDWEGLQGRLLSSSFSLRPGDKKYAAMIRDLKVIFDNHQHDGRVAFLYKTMLYYGQLNG